MFIGKREMIALLRSIGRKEHYGCPRHLMPENIRAYRKFLLSGFPQCSEFSENVIALPLTPAEKIAERFRNAVGE